VNVHGCTCIGYRHRGACSHHEACKLLQRRADAAIVATVHAADAERQKRYEALFGEDEPPDHGQDRSPLRRPRLPD